jgi:hypothetical protein
MKMVKVDTQLDESVQSNRLSPGGHSRFVGM